MKRQIEPAIVPSPYGNGTDHVERVIEPIEAMRKKGQLDDRQVDAAVIFRRAHEAMAGRLRCALDDAGGGGQQRSGRGFDAMALIREARLVLGVYSDYPIVFLVAYEGRKIREVAGDKATAREIDMLGVRLREGLASLADYWTPIRPPRIRGALYGSKAAAGTATRVEPGQVAHATSSRIYGFDPEGGQPMIRRRR